eukprot:COSAG02_NODE_1584_length_11821_cov_11.601604_8_plen_209_part_00
MGDCHNVPILYWYYILYASIRSRPVTHRMYICTAAHGRERGRERGRHPRPAQALLGLWSTHGIFLRRRGRTVLSTVHVPGGGVGAAAAHAAVYGVRRAAPCGCANQRSGRGPVEETGHFASVLSWLWRTACVGNYFSRQSSKTSYSGWVQDFDQQMATAADDDADVLPSDDGAIETGTEEQNTSQEDMEVGVEEAKDGKEPTSESDSD